MCCHPLLYTVPPSDALQINFFQNSNHIFNICFLWWKTEGKNYDLCAGLMGTDLRLNLIWKNRKVLLCYYHLCWCIWYWAASGDWANRRQWQKETSKGGISLLWTVFTYQKFRGIQSPSLSAQRIHRPQPHQRIRKHFKALIRSTVNITLCIQLSL